jgi:dihydroorotate dehydrogenase electron transfer subunit
MKYTQEICPILQKDSLNRTTFSFVVRSEKAVQTMQPGQFAQLRVTGKTLRRPISVCDFSREAQWIRFVFEIRGEGTAILSRLNEGDSLDILAPLGNGFAVNPAEKAVFVGGGIGVPPLLGASAAYGANATVLLGFRSLRAVILADEFQTNGADVRIATDDGTYGHHGFVTELLAARLEESPCDAVYACGPTPMLKLVSAEAEKRGVRCMVSLEERMACGIGACLGCACKTRREDGSETYSHVCKNGPVFDSREVVWQ